MLKVRVTRLYLAVRIPLRMFRRTGKDEMRICFSTVPGAWIWLPLESAMECPVANSSEIEMTRNFAGVTGDGGTE
jgi:hypothetical protein